jgi:hypothetical protein
MAFITEWLSQQTQAKVADLVVEDTLHDLQKRSGLLDSYLPLKVYDSRHFLKYVVEDLQPMASIISAGTEPPLSQTGTFRKIVAEMMKTGLARVYDEEFQWQMKEAMEQAMSNRITVQNMMTKDGMEMKGSNNTLAEYIFGTIEGVAKAQVELQNFLTWQLLQTGKISYTDSRTNQKVDIDFRTPGASYNHFPDPLTGSDLWSNASTANGLQDLESACEDYLDETGVYPDKIAMGRRLYKKLLRQESTKAAATQVRGASVGTVSSDMMKVVLEARDIPPIVTFDEKTKSELQDKSVVDTRFLNSDRFVFLKEKMGQRAMGPTLESGGRAGVYVVTREISKFPSVDATQSVSTCVIVPNNIKWFYSRKVD